MANSLKFYTDTMVDNGNRQDYSKLMSNAMLEGKSADYVKSLYDSRLNMINSDKNLEKYRNDDIMKQAQEYIQKNTKASPTTTEQAMSDMKNIYIGKDSMYAQALKNSQAATDASVKKAVGELEAQKASMNQGYADLFKQLYQEKKGTEKNIDQQLAHQGITGGMSETTRLGINTGYADALRQGEQERFKGISDIDRAITDVKLDGDIAKAQATIDVNNQAMAGYASYLQTVLNRADSDAAISRSEAADEKTYAYQYALSILQSGGMPTDELLATAGISKNDAQRIADNANYEKNLAVADQDKSYAYQYVISMLNNGVMPSDEILAMAGLPKADAQALYNAAQAQKVTSGNGGLSFAAAKDLADNGVITPEVRQALYSGGYTDAMISQRFTSRSTVQNVLSQWAEPDGTIPLEAWSAIQSFYPDLTANDLASMGYLVGDYYLDPTSMGETAQKLYSQFVNSMPPGSTLTSQLAQNQIQNLNLLLGRKQITPEEYNTLYRLIISYTR